MTSAAFAETYRRHFPAVRARCRRMLRAAQGTDAAEDVAQETFLRLWRSGVWVDASDPSAIAAWLRTTATRLSIDALARRCRADGDVEALPSNQPTSEDRVGARAALASVVAAAPREDLAAALLVRADGLTQPEAAARLAVSERTLRRRLERFDLRFAGRVVAALVLVVAMIASARSCAAATVDASSTETETETER